MDEATLIRMANQIAAFFAVQGHDTAVQGIANHIRSFWEPRMRRGLYGLADKAGTGLEPLVHDAVALLRRTDKVGADRA